MSGFVTPEEVARALAIVEGAKAKAPEPKRPESRSEFYEDFLAWVREYGIRDGGRPAATASTLFRHFNAWRTSRGMHPVTVGQKAWGMALHSLPLVKTQVLRDFMYRMELGPARYFQEWAKANPATEPVWKLNHKFHKRKTNPDVPKP